jgi:hypothetical protein
MEYYFRVNDWDKLAPDDDGFIDIKGFKVPYSVLPNEPEVTDDFSRLGPVLEETMARLWKRAQAR